MLLNALGVAATTDAVFQRTGAAADGYVSMAQLMRVGESYGAPLEFRKNWTLGDLRARLDLARPVIALAGLLGMLVGEQIVPLASRYFFPNSTNIASQPNDQE